jgi:LacI family transcriptional regulator
METGIASIICSTDFWEGRMHQVIGMMLSCRFDGILMAYNVADDPIIEVCRKQDIPVTRMTRNVAPPKSSAVILNDALGMRWMIDHLVSLGHRRIALVSGGQHFSNGRERHRCVLKAMSERGLTIDPELIAFSDGYAQKDGRRCCEELLDRGRPFTAIVSANDMTALGCYDALAARGLRIPDDVSVTGYNDIRFADLVSPALTTVDCKLYEAGRTMAKMLVDQINRPGAATWHKIMQPELVIRGSTGRARPIS